jgi:hypothetical protein
MTCLSSDRRAQLLARLAARDAQLTQAYETYLALLESGNKRYKFDSNEGSQSAWKWDLKELEQVIYSLERMVDHISRKLNGEGVVNMTLRRKFYQNRLSF